MIALSDEQRTRIQEVAEARANTPLVREALELLLLEQIEARLLPPPPARGEWDAGDQLLYEMDGSFSTRLGLLGGGDVRHHIDADEFRQLVGLSPHRFLEQRQDRGLRVEAQDAVDEGAWPIDTLARARSAPEDRPTFERVADAVCDPSPARDLGRVDATFALAFFPPGWSAPVLEHLLSSGRDEMIAGALAAILGALYLDECPEQRAALQRFHRPLRRARADHPLQQDISLLSALLAAFERSLDRRIPGRADRPGGLLEGEALRALAAFSFRPATERLVDYVEAYRDIHPSSGDRGRYPDPGFGFLGRAVRGVANAARGDEIPLLSHALLNGRVYANDPNAEGVEAAADGLLALAREPTLSGRERSLCLAALRAFMEERVLPGAARARLARLTGAARRVRRYLREAGEVRGEP